jgi:hypothetical protein
VVLGGNGVGDEILRLAFLRNFAPKNGEYGYVCDQRVHGLFSRAMPKLRPLRASRTMGPFKVSADEYLRDREGLAPWVDKVRVTREIFDREIPRYGEVMLSEDLMYAYFSSFGRYRGVKEPLFNALPERVEQARRWLATLPPGLKVGVSWRSGVPGVIRDVSYTRIDEWGPIFDATNTTFVLLQYSNSEEDIRKELELVREQFGVEIHVMPGLDLKDDFEGVVALCAELDIVVAPGTTLRETAAAAAATTWTLSTTPYLPDQWRIDQEDKHSDLIFPSMRHFTALQYESRQGAIAALGRELAEAGRVYAATANEPRERVRLSASG